MQGEAKLALARAQGGKARSSASAFATPRGERRSCEAGEVAKLELVGEAHLAREAAFARLGQHAKTAAVRITVPAQPSGEEGGQGLALMAGRASLRSGLGVIDIDQVSELLGVSRTWVEKTLRSDPTFPRPFRLGARRHIKLSDLQMWVDQKARAAWTRMQR